jgi:hypothetical protein
LPAAVASASASVSASASASAAPTALAPLLPGTFRCGQAACRAGKENCCDFSATRGGCIPIVREGLQAQVLACQQVARPEESVSGVHRCNDATDCGAREACCEEWIWLGGFATTCQPIRGGIPACGINEVCVSTCRGRGAECQNGVCRKPLKQVKCGASMCEGDRPACCGDPLACRTEAECSADPLTVRYRCASPRDCVEGEHCARGVLGTLCTRNYDPVNVGIVVCDSVKDCPSTKETCQAGPGHVACGASEDGLRVCFCEDARKRGE